MVCHRKRGLVVLSAIFALICSIAMIAVNALIFVARLLGKFSKETGVSGDSYKLLDNLPFADLQKYLQNAPNADNYSLVVLGNLAMMLLGIVLLILAIKMFASPVKEDGSVTYRGGIAFFATLISLIAAGAGFLAQKEIGGDTICLPFDKMGSGDFTLLVYWVYILLGFLAFLFAFIALLQKTNVFRTKVVIEKKKNQRFSPVVLGVEEKLKKIEQLKDVGAITENQYNAAVIRLLNSL